MLETHNRFIAQMEVIVLVEIAIVSMASAPLYVNETKVYDT